LEPGTVTALSIIRDSSSAISWLAIVQKITLVPRQKVTFPFRKNQSFDLPPTVPNDQITAAYCPPVGEKRCHTICTKSAGGKGRIIRGLEKKAEAPKIRDQAPNWLKKLLTYYNSSTFL
jgi:hypothetical protein